MALLASRFTLPSRSQNNFSSRNRDSPGNDAAADCEPIATATMLILARLGLRDCSQTAAARWSLTPSGSGSFTPLRYAAAPDPGARAPAAPLRSVPQPESGGDRAEMLAALARAADRVGAIIRIRRPGTGDDWLRGAVGMKDQPTLRFSLRCEAGRRLCFPLQPQEQLYSKPPRQRYPQTEPPLPGPRRLP
jgi:hypothetical protein